MVRNLLERVPRCGIAAVSRGQGQGESESSSRHLSRDMEHEEREAINKMLEESILLACRTLYVLLTL